jgi:hypothetical protein
MILRTKQLGHALEAARRAGVRSFTHSYIRAEQGQSTERNILLEEDGEEEGISQSSLQRQRDALAREPVWTGDGG